MKDWNCNCAVRMKRPLRVSDHALVRFLDRAGRLDVEGLRKHLETSLARAHETAGKIGVSEYSINADGLLYCVRNNVVSTVLEDGLMIAKPEARS